ncbi:hypothetical protein [Williamsia sp.]|uniref:hypothetical protein n=1 Tax=Williamsia sp. TaxID=1872085 RepID=UPI002F937611
MTARKTKAVEPDEIDLDDVNSDYYTDDDELDDDLEVDAEYEDEDNEPEPEPTHRIPRKRAAAKQSRIPANAPRPQDRQTKAAKKAPAKKVAAKRAPAKRAAAKRAPAKRAAVQVEAEDDEFIEIEHDGLVLTIPSDVLKWSMEATYAFEQGNAVTAVSELVGPRGFAEIRAKRYNNEEFGELFEKLAEVGGFYTSGN